jgi:YggT family protein
MPRELVYLLNLLITVLLVLIMAEVVVSWLVAYGRGISPYHPAIRTLRRIVDPILDPFRRMLPPSKTGGWDLSPMLVMVVLYVVRSMINGIR